MSRWRTTLVAVSASLLLPGIIAAVLLGFVGVGTTVQAGTQATVCGVTFGVSSSGSDVELLGVSDELLAPGDTARASTLCVIEVVFINEGNLGDDSDGSGFDIQLRWRLW